MFSSPSLSGPSSSLAFAECDFLAGEVDVWIVPAFSSAALRFIGRTLGPFKAERQIQVPLWLATQLAEARKCHFVIPEWLNTDRLQQHRYREINEQRTFIPLPAYYNIVAKSILHYEELPQHKEITVLLKDIDDARQNKIRAGLSRLEAGQPLLVKLNHISQVEIETMREFACQTLDDMYQLQIQGQIANYDRDRQQEIYNTYPIYEDEETDENNNNNNDNNKDTDSNQTPTQSQHQSQRDPSSSSAHRRYPAIRTTGTSQTSQPTAATTTPGRSLRRFHPR